VDSGQFKGVQDLKLLEDKVRGDLERYIQLAQRMGYYSEYRYTLGTDLIAELEGMCLDLVKEFRRPVVFAGQLVFQREKPVHAARSTGRPLSRSSAGSSSPASRSSSFPSGCGSAGLEPPGRASPARVA